MRISLLRGNLMKVKPPFWFPCDSNWLVRLENLHAWSMLEAVRGAQRGECKALCLAGSGRRWWATHMSCFLMRFSHCLFLQVEEVKKHQHCLAFSSSGPQSQTYYICFDTFTEYLRWLRQVSKVSRNFVQLLAGSRVASALQNIVIHSFFFFLFPPTTASS